ncbi:CehA/McbA family metallohydrolase [Clostridium sp. DJ247]|uniref:CehA/McbA family metallohydrolase n=1 Tax=Clostridium sp. DJ247 TaxID=2726188 RepID=UPI00162732CD|nr:CehA/McbA family metallohydrolase [Clostridium sp. DJ247]
MITFNGMFKGSEKLPLHTHKFNLENSLSCLRINIKTDYKAWIQVLLWDEDKKLRLQRLHLKEFSSTIINEDPVLSNFSAVPGILEKGRYTLEITCEASQEISYLIEIFEEDIQEKVTEEKEWNYEIWCDGNYEGEGIYLNRYNFKQRLKTGLRWYKGDFHTHTNISDGKLTPEEGMLQAKKMNLDFFVVTDHNILPCKWVKGDVLPIPGIEITPLATHFNALGLKRWIDFRVNSENGGLLSESGMNRLMKEARENGALCSINHAELPPWQWLHKETLIENIDVLEIINDPTYPKNREATEKVLNIWNTLWNEGYHIWGIGGSDSHLLPNETYEGADKPSLIGDPSTYVLADGLSASEILNSVSKGRVYVSRGLELDIDINCNEKNYSPGDSLSELFLSNSDEKKVTYSFLIKSGEKDLIKGISIFLIENGNVILQKNNENNMRYDISFNWKGSAFTWSRLEIRDGEGNLLLFTNPIYKGSKKHTIFNWGQLLQKLGGH